MDRGVIGTLIGVGCVLIVSTVAETGFGVLGRDTRFGAVLATDAGGIAALGAPALERFAFDGRVFAAPVFGILTLDAFALDVRDFDVLAFDVRAPAAPAFRRVVDLTLDFALDFALPLALALVFLAVLLTFFLAALRFATAFFLRAGDACFRADFTFFFFLAAPKTDTFRFLVELFRAMTALRSL